MLLLMLLMLLVSNLSTTVLPFTGISLRRRVTSTVNFGLHTGYYLKLWLQCHPVSKFMNAYLIVSVESVTNVSNLWKLTSAGKSKCRNTLTTSSMGWYIAKMKHLRCQLYAYSRMLDVCAHHTTVIRESYILILISIPNVYFFLEWWNGSSFWHGYVEATHGMSPPSTLEYTWTPPILIMLPNQTTEMWLGFWKKRRAKCLLLIVQANSSSA